MTDFLISFYFSSCFHNLLTVDFSLVGEKAPIFQMSVETAVRREGVMN